VSDTETDPGVEETELPPEFNAIRALENECVPTRGREPRIIDATKRLGAAAPPWVGEVHIPTWEWSRPHEPGDLFALDATAQWVSAISSVRVAFGKPSVRVRGVQPFTRAPGWWKVDLRGVRWGREHELMHPLGTGKWRTQTWLTHPTLALLMELVNDGKFPEFPVIDSLTATTDVRLTTWSDWIRDRRTELLDSDAPERIMKVFKVRYSQAVEMMLHGNKFDYQRPDWAQAIQAQAAATVWRRAWRSVLMGHGPVAAGSVDELVYTADDLAAIMETPEPPLTLDPTGRRLGTFKIKRYL
jgi:hypothetical protein